MISHVQQEFMRPVPLCQSELHLITSLLYIWWDLIASHSWDQQAWQLHRPPISPTLKVDIEIGGGFEGAVSWAPDDISSATQIWLTLPCFLTSFCYWTELTCLRICSCSQSGGAVLRGSVVAGTCMPPNQQDLERTVCTCNHFMFEFLFLHQVEYWIWLFQLTASPEPDWVV